MARVLIPHMARRYNANPRGSATTTVTMAGDNPFERRTSVLNSTRSMLPGMGALGTIGEDAPAAPAPAPAAGVNWNQLITGVTQAGTQVAQVAATNAVNRLTAPKAAKVPVAGQTTYLPVVNPNYQPASKLPWILGGVGVLVVGVVGFLVLRKKH